MPRKRTFSKQRGQSGLFTLYGQPDKVMLGIMIGLSIFGLIMVYSASFISHSNTFHFFIRQLIFIVLGSILAIMVYLIDYKLLAKLIIPGLIFSIILLIAVLIPGIGKEVQGASRWIDLKVFDLQPSEVVKLAFIIYLAAWAAKQQKVNRVNSENIKEHFTHELLPFVTLLAVICGLVLLQPDLATTALIGMIAVAVYFLSGRDHLHTLGTGFILLVLVIAGLGAALLAPYRLARVETYIDFLTTGEVQDPLGSGYQLKNQLVAVGSGGLFGVGFGESRQKFHYLGQTAATDNIFAVIAEEFGFIGSLALACTFFYFLIRGLTIAGRVPDRFGKLLASGIIIWLVLQAFLHIGTNIGMIPVTGMPLPYISYGGSSVVIVLVASGIFLNISRYATKKR